MRSTQRKLASPAGLLAATLAFIAAVGVTSCSYRNEDLNRVVDPYWSKEYFAAEDEWYLRSTVVDAPPEHGWISIADGDWLMLEKIRWEVTEKFLIGWRTYSIAPGSENEELPGAAELYKGQAVALYAISDHFDIRRDFDATSGEQANTISENRDRLWFDRAFMRVDWSDNMVSTFKYHLGIAEPAYCGVESNDGTLRFNYPCIGGGQNRFMVQGAQAPADPKRWRFEPDYFEVTTRHEVAPDILGIVGYYGPAMAGDYSSAVIDVRHAFMKVPKSDYVALPMPPTVVLEDADGNEVRDANGFAVKIPVNDRFGYFGSLGRVTFDENRGMVQSGQVFNASRFNLWEKNRHADGSLIPLEARDAKEGAITYYTNVEHPKQLIPASQRVADQWNKAFRETVWKINEAKYTGALDATGVPSDVPNIFVMKENDCNIANVGRALDSLNVEHSDLVELITKQAARRIVNDEVVAFDGSLASVEARYNHANDEIENLGGNGLGSKGESFTQLQGEESQALHDLERICSALEYYTADDITTGRAAPDDVAPFLYQRLGDTRYSLLNLIVGDFQSGWLGLGPPYADPITAETISGTANVAIGLLDRSAARAAQYVQALNGEANDLDLIYGLDIARYMDQKLLENSKLATRRASQQTRERISDEFSSRLGRNELLKEVPPTRGDERMSRIEGSDVEQLLINEADVSLFGAFDPIGASAAGLDESMMEQVSPIRNAALRQIGSEREQKVVRMGMRAADPPEMVDTLLIGQAIAYKDMSYAERFKKLRSDIYVAVMLHEVGHNTGLFHNFAGSSDAINYGANFWEIQDLPGDIDDALGVISQDNDAKSVSRVQQLNHCKDVIANASDDFDSSALTTHECLRQSEGLYSSIMDYHGNWNSDFNGLGPYDFAATKFAYGQLLEVFPTENLAASIDEPGEMKKNIFYNDWRDIPEMFAGATREERVSKMYDRDYVKMDWNTSSTRQAPLANEVPYRFGYGAYPEPTIKVFDFGPDTRTNAAFQLNNYYQKFFFSHFARNRLWDFDAVNGTIGADAAVMDDFTEKMQWFFFYRGTDPNFAGTYADEDFLATTVTGMNHFAHVLAEPNSGDMHTMPNFQLFGLSNLRPDDRSATEPLDVAIQWSSFNTCDALTLNESADPDVMEGATPGFAAGNVPLGEGRPFFIGFTDDYVDFYIRYVGHYWTKQVAIQYMAINFAWFPRVDADNDYRAFDVGWYRLFPREVSQLYANLITQNDIELGGFLDADGNYVRPDLIPLEGAPSTAGLTRVLPQIAINHNYSAYVYANAFLDTPYDDQMDFTKTVQIAVDGATDDTRSYDDAGARDVAAGCIAANLTPEAFTACSTVASFTHPDTGITVRGLKVGEFPVAFDLVQRLNLLKERFLRLESCQTDFDDNGLVDGSTPNSIAGDSYCACIGNIGYARESQADGGNFVSTCSDNYETVLPGEAIQVPASTRLNTNVEELTIACTGQDLRNRRDGAREAMDSLLDYVNDLRTYNKYINGRF
ncbi:MAG: hypothetical protein Q8O67_13735 [Deltaproteobacteria bacterium]|nr:hypothetical protein [Deltaproteobacteria bacterium]